MRFTNVVLVAVALASLAATSFAAVPFRPLPDFGFGGSPYDVNAAGRIVGAVRVSDDAGPYVPVVWDSATATPVVLPNVNGGYAVAINSNGDIVGTEFQAAGPYGVPVLWSNGQRVELPDLGEGGYANDINESGVIIGLVIVNGEFRAARWVAGELEVLPLPEPSGVTGVVWSLANSINSAGTIVGTVQAPLGTPSAAVRWDAGGVTVIPSPGLETKGISTDNLGNVLINGYFGADPRRVPALVQPDGSVRTLDVPAEFLSGAVSTAMSRNTIVAGYYYGSGPEGFRIEAVAWPNGVFTPLEMPAGQRYAFPLGVGNNGIVFGYATDGITGRSVPCLWDLELPSPSLTASSASGTRGQAVQISATSQRATRKNVGHSVELRVNGAAVGRGITDAQGVVRFAYTIPSDATDSTLTVRMTDEDGAFATSVIRIAGSSLTAPPSSAPQGVTFSAPSPNPAQARTTLRFSLDRESDVELAVFDVTGRAVATLTSGRRSAGAHTVEWAAEALPSGTYLVRLRTERGTITQRLQRMP